MKRFYNLKIGKPDVMGSALEVDLEKPLEARIKDLTAESPGCAIALLKMNRKRAVYEFREPSCELGELRTMVETGNATYIHLAVTPKGAMTVEHAPKNRQVYLSEINAKKAKNMEEQASCWRMMQIWV